MPSRTNSLVVGGAGFGTTDGHGDDALHLWPGPVLEPRLLKER